MKRALLFKLEVILPFLIAASAIAVTGCRSEKSTPRHRVLVGIAESIDESTGEVTMIWYNEKTDKEIKLTGQATDETEFFINGRAAKLTDIRVKDRVKVTGFASGENTDRVYVVTRVDVDRDEDWISTPAPTTQPAEAG